MILKIKKEMKVPIFYREFGATTYMYITRLENIRKIVYSINVVFCFVVCFSNSCECEKVFFHCFFSFSFPSLN